MSTPAAGHLAVSVWVRLLKTHGLVLRELRRRRVPDALTLPQFDVLVQLHRRPEGMTSRELTRELLVTAGASGGYVEVTVADSGIGIDSGDVARVFDPLFTTKERGKGTGLGLTIARDVVAAHGGTIAVSSRRHEGTSVVALRTSPPALSTISTMSQSGRRL